MKRIFLAVLALFCLCSVAQADYMDGVNNFFMLEESLGNSSETTLSGSATFTGNAEENLYPQVGVSCFSDTDGTLYFDFSVNGTDWRTFPSSGFEVTANIHEFHTAVKLGRYFRLRFVNSSSEQSIFQVYAYYGFGFVPSVAPVNQTLGKDHEATVVRQYPMRVDKALGRLGGITGKDKFGYITGLGTTIQIGTPSTWVDVWSYGG